jgi:hypothetical protein
LAQEKEQSRLNRPLQPGIAPNDSQKPAGGRRSFRSLGCARSANASTAPAAGHGGACGGGRQETPNQRRSADVTTTFAISPLEVSSAPATK